MTDCINCETTLVSVFPDLEDEYKQYHNALEIGLFGGYGMFFDNIDGNHHILLCHDCSHDLCATLPWLNRLINPAHSHAHREEFWAANPDHEGWDRRE